MPTTSSYASSRRANTEQKKLTRQIVFFVGLTIVLLAVFLLVVVPGVIRIAGNFVKPSATASDSQVFVQVPLVSSPFSATNSANISVSGYSEKGNMVVLVNNDQEATRQAANDDGSFSVSLTLDKGDNHLKVFAIDADNHQSEKSKEYIVTFNDQPPKLDVTDPQDKQTITGKNNQNLTIKGNSDKGVKVYINDRLIFSNDDGSFSTLQRLNDGDNALDIRAVDPAGNATEKKLMVTFHQ
jgi:hypothetical protein